MTTHTSTTTSVILPVSTPSKPINTKAKFSAIILAAAIAVSPFTIKSEGHLNKAYLDPAKIPTICNGHTKGVKLGDVATDAQCAIYLQEDMIEHMNAVAATTPSIVENSNALKAAGDFTFNAGPGAWAKSPMAKYFAKKEWGPGCKAFVGYYTGATYKAAQPNLKCHPKVGAPGKWVCELPGLVTRRVKESHICLTGAE